VSKYLVLVLAIALLSVSGVTGCGADECTPRSCREIRHNCVRASCAYNAELDEEECIYNATGTGACVCVPGYPKPGDETCMKPMDGGTGRYMCRSDNNNATSYHCE
jgi:hypothetical protein